jgi:hypothetical protein
MTRSFSLALIPVVLLICACQKTDGSGNDRFANKDRSTTSVKLRQEDIDNASIVCRGTTAYLIGNTVPSGRGDDTFDGVDTFVVLYPGGDAGCGNPSGPAK